MPAVLAPWLDERSTVALILGPEAETSALASGVALAVAGGRAFSGFTAPRALDVLYLSDREDAAAIRARMASLAPAVVPPLDDEALRRVHLLTVADRPSGLGTVEELCATVAETAARLVILDCAAPPYVVDALRSAGAAVIRLLSEAELRFYALGRIGHVVRLTQSAEGLRLVWLKPRIQELPVILTPPPSRPRVYFERIRH